MVLPRPTVLRGFAPARQLRSIPRTASRSQWQHIARRGYAEGGHGSHPPPGSDLPWLIGGIAVTIPSCYFLWPSPSHGDAHGAHGAHGSHAKHDDEEEHEEAEEEKEDSQDAPEEDSAPEPKADDSAEKSKDDESKADTEKPPQSDPPKEGPNDSGANTEGENMPESKGEVDGAQFKGKTNKGDEDNKMPDTRKVEDDHKGGKKLRIDSGYGKNLGEGPLKGDDDRETASSAKPISDNPGDISKKQQGLSTTPTRHSSDIGNDPEKSKKGEGIPETAKAMGTVTPDRPQAESPGRGEKA